KRVVDEAAAVTAVYPVGSLTNAYALAAIPARHALERGRWREATTLAVRPSPEWRAAEALTHFAHALGAARTGDTAGARAAISKLDDIERTEEAAGGAHARASEQAGDLATARTRYREYLALMRHSDGARAELEVARGALSAR